MAKKKKFHGSKGTVLPSQDKRTPVSNIPTGSTGPYGDTMEYADKEIKRNTNFKKKTD